MDADIENLSIYEFTLECLNIWTTIGDVILGVKLDEDSVGDVSSGNVSWRPSVTQLNSLFDKTESYTLFVVIACGARDIGGLDHMLTVGDAYSSYLIEVKGMSEDEAFERVKVVWGYLTTLMETASKRRRGSEKNESILDVAAYCLIEDLLKESGGYSEKLSNYALYYVSFVQDTVIGESNNYNLVES